MLARVCQSLSTPADHRRLEPQIDDRVDKEIHEIAVVGLVDPLPHVQDAIEGRGRIACGAGLEDGEGFAQQRLDSAGVLVADKPAQGAIDVPERILVDGRQAGNVHDVEVEDQLPQVPLTGGFPDFEKPLGGPP